jgi:hypothetical protein
MSTALQKVMIFISQNDEISSFKVLVVSSSTTFKKYQIYLASGFVGFR